MNIKYSFGVVLRALPTHHKLSHTLHTQTLVSGSCSKSCGHTTTCHTRTLVSGSCSRSCGHTTTCHTHCTHGTEFKDRVQGPADTPQHVTHIAHTEPSLRIVFKVLRAHHNMSHTDPSFRIVFKVLRTHHNMSHTLHTQTLVSGSSSGLQNVTKGTDDAKTRVLHAT